MCNRQAEFWLKIRNRLGKMLENLNGGFFDLHQSWLWVHFLRPSPTEPTKVHTQPNLTHHITPWTQPNSKIETDSRSKVPLLALKSRRCHFLMHWYEIFILCTSSIDTDWVRCPIVFDPTQPNPTQSNPWMDRAHDHLWLTMSRSPPMQYNMLSCGSETHSCHLEVDANHVREDVLEMLRSVSKKTAADDDAESNASAWLSGHDRLEGV